MEKVDNEKLAQEVALFLTQGESRDHLILLKADHNGAECYVLAVKEEAENEKEYEITPLAIVINEEIFKNLKLKNTNNE